MHPKHIDEMAHTTIVAEIARRALVDCYEEANGNNGGNLEGPSDGEASEEEESASESEDSL